MSAELIPPPPHHHHAHGHLIAIAGTFGALAGIVILCIIFLHIRVPTFGKSSPANQQLSTKQFPGSLILYSYVPWRAPDGDSFQGLVNYNPSTGAMSQTMPPLADGVSALSSPNAVTADNSSILAFGLVNDAMQLVEYSLKSQSVARVIDTSKDRTPLFPAIQSGDGSTVAYVASSTLYVSVNGTTHPLADEGMPIGFLPDGSKLLLNTGSALAISSLSGTATPVTGAISTKDVQFVLSPDGSYLSAFSQNGIIQLFAVDWNADSVTSIGFVPFNKTNGLFGPDNSFLSMSTSTLTSYKISGHAVTQTASYVVSLPYEVQPIAWTK